jgi:NADH-quinone oxidoreductase subunit L
LHESPAAITIPLIVLAILSIIGGWVGIPELFMHGGHRLSSFLQPVFAQSSSRVSTLHLTHKVEYMLIGVSVGISLIAIIFAWLRYSRYEKRDREATGIVKAVENKWYVDELYNSIIVGPLRSISGFFSNVIERKGIDGIVNGTGKAVNYGSRQLRWVQSGQVGAYVLLMVLGMLVLFIIQFFF